jgi:ATP-binding cassette subfamily F protein 3
MVAFVQFTGLSLAFGDRDILLNADVKLMTGSRAALCGANGSGKSTLMKVMAGIIPGDSGERTLEKGATVAYLPQSGLVHGGKSLFDEAKTAFARFEAMERRRAEIEERLEGAKTDGGDTGRLLAEAGAINETLEEAGFRQLDKRINIVLRGLGFAENDFARPTEEFSGGWQMRVALAKVLLESPDILLLDEPTNYLDIEGRAWLEQWLRKFGGAFLLVSHDRYFLDASVNEVYELFQGRLKRYPGTYSDYEKRRAAELESLLAAYKLQQEGIERAEKLIRRFRYKASKAAMVQDRVKKLEKIERIEIPENLKKLSISLPPPPRSGRIALKLEGIGKSYGERRVLSGLDLVLEAGERLLVSGVNGAGKSTLLRIIAGRDNDHEGTVSYGAGIASAYFSQESAETLDSGCGDTSVLGLLEESAPVALVPRLRDMLGAFLFRGDDMFKKTGVLSGGERSRLALLRLLLRPANLLILDEPANHLDIYAKDALQDALLAFGGTIIFVSHDRAFMEALSRKTLILSADNAPRLHYGGYADYMETLERLDARDRERRGSALSTGEKRRDNRETFIDAAPPVSTVLTPALRASAPVCSATPIPGAQAAREASKRKAAAIRRLERSEAALLEKTLALEAEKKEAEEALSDPEVYTSGEKTREAKARLSALTETLDACSAEWERIASDLASLRPISN